MSTQIEPLLTIDDLDVMPEDGNRYEIIEGELFASRAPTLTHQSISMNLSVSVKNHLAQNPIGKVWTTPGVIFSHFSGVIPDLVFVSNERLSEIASGERITGAPDLVIEIVSPGAENERRDRVAKRQLYGKHGVKEYWVVELENRNVEIYSLKGKTLKRSALYEEKDELTSPTLPGFSCEVESVFGL